MTVNSRSRSFWMTVGHFATAGWMGYVLWRTGGNIRDPFFDLIFVVPLAGWIAGLAIARIIVWAMARKESKGE